MSEKLNLEIIVPEKTYFQGPVDVVTIDFMYAGQISFLAKHIDLAGNIDISMMTVKDNGHILHYALGGGMAYMNQKENTLRVIVNSAENSDEIDIDRAMKAKERAEQEISASESGLSVKRAEIRLKRALNRINVKHVGKI